MYDHDHYSETFLRYNDKVDFLAAKSHEMQPVSCFDGTDDLHLEKWKLDTCIEILEKEEIMSPPEFSKQAFPLLVLLLPRYLAFSETWFVDWLARRASQSTNHVLFHSSSAAGARRPGADGFKRLGGLVIPVVEDTGQ